ncbi:putative RNA uridine N3 methyltransferase [Ignicoccus hospitalis]|uniref:RNA methyltransferase n=1 Tax=Ignicoccus hospitalis (strain KIN4/I / DSM 18386 / JCM 14125) TaxID=453591 RepID=A8AAI1_IGNH4|nr:putative RNA uridine N3 methyltransferase [Ignicoccus hospitalis]ABU81933.1 conserved hypothetical protein [Ignicoccus hospitalis KIN4/I]HIH89908.1 hypothetical protein [Desulfurococcaceae archaeon]
MKCPFRRLRIAIPADALSSNPSLREKTLVAGYLARAAAAARAESVDVYGPEGPGSDVLMSVLEYLSYPTYLRKLIVPLKPELKYAGVLPPLAVKALNEGFKDREEGLFFKFGLIVECKRGSIATIDVGEPERVTHNVKKCKKNVLVLVGFNDKKRVVKVLPAKRGIWRGEYLGFEVNYFDNIYELVEFYKGAGFKALGTSRRGTWPGKLRDYLGSNVGVLFGSPDKGLLDKYPDLELDALVNLFPCQGVRTVRLEEAVWGFAALWNSLEGGLCETR